MAKRKASGKSPPDDTKAQLERAIKVHKDSMFELRLYVAGMTPRSRKAIDAVRDFAEENLKGRYRLEVVDIYQSPEAARNAQVVAAPTLVKQLPLPLRRLIGDMTDKRKVLMSMDIKVPRGSKDKTSR